MKCKSLKIIITTKSKNYILQLQKINLCEKRIWCVRVNKNEDWTIEKECCFLEFCLTKMKEIVDLHLNSKIDLYMNSVCFSSFEISGKNNLPLLEEAVLAYIELNKK